MKLCLYCNKEIPITRKANKYCSKECVKSAWYKRNKIPKHNPNYKCNYCGKDFIAKFKKDAKFCTKKCWDKGTNDSRKPHRIEKEKEWKKNNPEKIRLYHRINYDRNKEKIRLLKRLRSTANIRNTDDWIKICEKQGNKCNHCKINGTVHTLQIDHIVPFSVGGSNELSNIQALCGHCNKKKGNRFIG